MGRLKKWLLLLGTTLAVWMGAFPAMAAVEANTMEVTIDKNRIPVICERRMGTRTRNFTHIT